MRRIVLISVLFLFVAITYAQKMQKVTATYTYYAPENVTLEEANTNGSTEDVLPIQLSFEDFQKWLVKLRKIDKEAIVNNKQISIKN